MRDIRLEKNYEFVCVYHGFSLFFSYDQLTAAVVFNNRIIETLEYEGEPSFDSEKIKTQLIDVLVSDIDNGYEDRFVNENLDRLVLYKQKKDTYIRDYDGIGYITSTGIFNDRIVNQSGSVFLSAITRSGQTIEDLVDKVLPCFIGAEREVLINDAIEFYDMLVEDGFLVKGKTEKELVANDKGFTYQAITPKTIKDDFSPVITRSSVDTQTLLEEHFDGKPHLTSFQIELTSRCNERCVHCYIPHDLKLYDIKPELYYDVLKQLSKMGVLSVTLSGGEPMLHPHFIDFLKAAKDYDFYVNILSNLTLLNDEMVEAMKSVNVSSVQVSLYSMIPEHHDSITCVKGSFEKTRKAILKLIENDIPVHVSCPTMKGNKDDYGDVLDWCHEHKIRAQTDFIMMAEYNHETSNLANRLSVEETATVIRDIMEKDVDYQRTILRDDFVDRCNAITFHPERRLCGVGISTCCMVANGNVYPCPGWQECVLGNLYEKPLEEIWNKSEKIEWLRQLKYKDLGKGRCCKCDKAAFCAPCLVRNANESKTGNPLEINEHFCRVAEVNKKIAMDYREQNLKEI